MFVRILLNHNFSQNVCHRGRYFKTCKPTTSLSNVLELRLGLGLRLFCNSVGFSRPISSSDTKATNVNKTYKVVYNFSFIRAAGAIAKSKVYQTWITGIAIPSSIALYYTGLLAQETIVSVVLIGLAGTAATYSVGAVCNRLVGFIYVSQDNMQVKISHLDFWGRRIDNVYPIDDFVPISELSKNTLYTNVKCYSSEHSSLKLCLKYGSIVDMDLFRTIFGYGVI